MPLEKIVFELKIRRPLRRRQWHGGPVLQVTLTNDSLSIADFSRPDCMPIAIAERAHAIGGHVYVLEQSIRWGTFIFGTSYGNDLHEGPLSEDEVRQTHGEILDLVNKSVILTHPEPSKRLTVEKGAQINIGLYNDNIYSGYKSFYIALEGTVKRILEVDFDDYRPDAPRSKDEADSLMKTQLGPLSIPPR